MSPWDDGTKLQEQQRITRNRREWENAYALSTRIWQVRFRVHHPGYGNYDFGSQGPMKTSVYTGDQKSTGTHYDVLETFEEQDLAEGTNCTLRGKADRRKT